MLAGSDKLTNSQDRSIWTPEAIKQFGQYYEVSENHKPKFDISEYIWQKARLERLANSEEPQEISDASLRLRQN